MWFDLLLNYLIMGTTLCIIVLRNGVYCLVRCCMHIFIISVDSGLYETNISYVFLLLYYSILSYIFSFISNHPDNQQFVSKDTIYF